MRKIIGSRVEYKATVTELTDHPYTGEPLIRLELKDDDGEFLSPYGFTRSRKWHGLKVGDEISFVAREVFFGENEWGLERPTRINKLST